jgi:hypothetical protein
MVGFLQQLESNPGWQAQIDVMRTAGFTSVIVTDNPGDFPANKQASMFAGVYAYPTHTGTTVEVSGFTRDTPGTAEAYTLMNVDTGRIRIADDYFVRDPFVVFVHEMFHIGRIGTAGHPTGWQDEVNAVIQSFRNSDGSLVYGGTQNRAVAPGTLRFDHNTFPLPIPNPRCFLAGTPITMADGSEKPIEEIKVGDLVMAFDEFADKGMGRLVPQRVTRTMQGTTTEVIDLRGLRVTPGHRFLSDGGAWLAIEKILKDDGIIVEQRAEGPVQVRARTGAAIGSVDDILVPVVFVDKGTRRERIAQVRAGIPCLGRKGVDGTIEVFNLYRITAHHGGTILPDGRSIDQDGVVGDYLGWPQGSSPLDATYMHDWIVKLDGQPFRPQWIADISDADEGRQTINGTPVMRSSIRDSGPSFTHALSPVVVQGGRTTSGPNRKARRKQTALVRVK